MAQSSRDQNQVAVTSGSFNGVTMPLKADHATGYLKVILYPTTLAAPAVSNPNAVHDSNSVRGALGSYNGAVKPLLATNANGYLRIVNS